jgi:hypothetical protein
MDKIDPFKSYKKVIYVKLVSFFTSLLTAKYQNHSLHQQSIALISIQPRTIKLSKLHV